MYSFSTGFIKKRVPLISEGLGGRDSKVLQMQIDDLISEHWEHWWEGAKMMEWFQMVRDTPRYDIADLNS